MCGAAVMQDASATVYQEQVQTTDRAQYDAPFPTHPGRGATAEMALTTHDSKFGANDNGRLQTTGRFDNTHPEMPDGAQVEPTEQVDHDVILEQFNRETASIIPELKADLRKMRTDVHDFGIFLRKDHSTFNDTPCEFFSSGLQALSPDHVDSVLSIFKLQEVEMRVLSELKSSVSKYEEFTALLPTLPMAVEDREQIGKELEETRQAIVNMLKSTFMD